VATGVLAARHPPQRPSSSQRREDEQEHGKLPHPEADGGKVWADAARVAIADAGDAIEDANFEETVANKTILKLYELKKWLEEMIRDAVLVDSTEEYTKARDNEAKILDVV